MTTPAGRASRCFGAAPGYELLEPVELPGWEQHSRWGWDPDTSSFYAQLWRNTSTSALPDSWISAAFGKHYPMPGCIVLAIMERTAIDPAAVVAALGLAHPNPSCHTPDEMFARLRTLMAEEKTDYVQGQLAALAWTAGLLDTTAAGTQPWPEHTCPTPTQVDAEQHMATGLLHRERVRRRYFDGIDEALWWVLGR